MSKSRPVEYNTEPRDVRPRIREALKGVITVDELAEYLLASGWDYTDPKRRMGKPPEEVQEFLDALSIQVCMWSHLTPGRQNLLQMICDSYCRWIDKQIDA